MPLPSTAPHAAFMTVRHRSRCAGRTGDQAIDQAGRARSRIAAIVVADLALAGDPCPLPLFMQRVDHAGRDSPCCARPRHRRPPCRAAGSIQPPKNAARSAVSSTIAPQYWIASCASAGLLRRTEGAELLDRRQRLLDRVVGAATRVLVCGTPVICDSVALSSSKVRRPTSDSAGSRAGAAGGRHRPDPDTARLRSPMRSKDRKNRSFRTPFSSADDRAERRQLLAGARGVAGATDGGVQRLVGLAGVRLDTIHADADALDRQIGDRGAGSRLMKVGLVNWMP